MDHVGPAKGAREQGRLLSLLSNNNHIVAIIFYLEIIGQVVCLISFVESIDV